MTKTSTLVDQPTEKKKPIEFVKFLDAGLNFDTGCSKPSSWDNIKLLSKNYLSSKFDLMFAWNDKDPNHGILYLGHWNDEVVE